jgi:hypothetical protein
VRGIALDVSLRDLRDLVTDDDDQYDIGFVLWMLGTLMFLVLSGINWQKFDPWTWGGGFGAVLAAGGAMSWMRKDRE